jgi:tetratricopeptide (TPR) repeat protein
MVLDNAESILDPQGPDGREIYGVVKELSQFSNICLAITTRISSLPPGCKRMDVPTLSIDAARSTFHRICGNDERPDLIDKILKQLDLHPLSVTLLATVADQNKWDNDRLAREWEQRQTAVLKTEHNESLAATIELSLDSPTFKGLGPNARELLGVIAFLPQGVNENNVIWLFPTTPNASTIFNKFCILSLTYQNNGFITMLVPLQDHLRPHHPKTSPLLCVAKERYFTRMSVEINPNSPDFRETRWIKTEDTSVEHMLNIFTSIDENSEDVWRACADFMRHLYWHKPQRTVLGPKVEGLPDDHRFKSECLFQLARLLGRLGDHIEQKRLLNHVLGLERGRGNDHRIIHILNDLSDANRMLGLYEEGINQAKEALEIQEGCDDAEERALCLNYLARLLYDDKQLSAAEEAVSRAVGLLPEKGQEFRLCQSHQILGRTYRSLGEREKAIHHLETALGIATPFNWHHHLFWINFSLAVLFLDEAGLEDAHAHIKQAKSHAINNLYRLGRAVLLEAEIWYQENKLKEATKEVSGAIEIFEKLGATNVLEACRDLLKKIEHPTEGPATLGGSDPSGER